MFGEAFDFIKITSIIGFLAVMWVWTANHRKHEFAVIHQLAINGDVDLTIYQDCNRGADNQ